MQVLPRRSSFVSGPMRRRAQATTDRQVGAPRFVLQCGSCQAGAMPEKPAEDRTKDKFRVALERKRSQQQTRSDAAHTDSKVHAEHARVGGKRTFRRKSG
jgi:hypothetical protein